MTKLRGISVLSEAYFEEGEIIQLQPDLSNSPERPEFSIENVRVNEARNNLILAHNEVPQCNIAMLLQNRANIFSNYRKVGVVLAIILKFYILIYVFRSETLI